ncbi:MAG: hypothetical protein AAFY59_20620, partial [Pseudomonadota bacterium]
MNGLDSSLLNGHTGNPVESSLLGSSSPAHIDGVGSLGDEAMPFGSLGLSKSGYIPVGRVDDNPREPNGIASSPRLPTPSICAGEEDP